MTQHTVTSSQHAWHAPYNRGFDITTHKRYRASHTRPANDDSSRAHALDGRHEMWLYPVMYSRPKS